MLSRELTVGILVALGCLLVLIGLHERHYRSRRWEIGAARYEGLEHRLTTLESILMEQRDT